MNPSTLFGSPASPNHYNHRLLHHIHQETGLNHQQIRVDAADGGEYR
jgi:hypothetical protein